MNTTTEAQSLAAKQATGLRALADLIEANPFLADALEYSLIRTGVNAHIHGDKVAKLARFARAAKASGHTVSKDIDERWHNLDIDVAGIKIKVLAYREEVCDRVVTGTETVTKTVKDPARLAEVPEIEVTETVETVEWVCRPILAATVDGAA